MFIDDQVGATVVKVVVAVIEVVVPVAVTVVAVNDVPVIDVVVIVVIVPVVVNMSVTGAVTIPTGISYPVSRTTAIMKPKS